MLFNDRYEIETKINDVVLDYPPSNYYFTLRDSIFNLFPYASFKFKDSSGQFNEYATFIKGMKVDFTLGTKDLYVTCPFIIIKDSIVEQASQNTFGGMTEIALIHDYYNTQSKMNGAFNDEVSNIIRKKVSSYNFNSVSIQSTLNKGLWYQPFEYDATFMVEKLLPFAYSTSANDTPFYLFIDINNDLHFTSYYNMFNKNAVINLYLTTNSQIDSLTNSNIIFINTSQMSLLDLKPHLNKTLYYYDNKGNIKEEEKTIQDYIPNGTSFLTKTNLENKTGLQKLLSYDRKLPSTKNNNLGLVINSLKETFHNEKLVITINLNTELRAGKKVNINIPTNIDKEKTEISTRFSGNYLVESSYHRWTGNTGISILILSRQSTQLPNLYRNKKEVING